VRRQTQLERRRGMAGWQGVAACGGDTYTPFKSRKTAEEITQENC